MKIQEKMQWRPISKYALRFNELAGKCGKLKIQPGYVRECGDREEQATSLLYIILFELLYYIENLQRYQRVSRFRQPCIFRSGFCIFSPTADGRASQRTESYSPLKGWSGAAVLNGPRCRPRCSQPLEDDMSPKSFRSVDRYHSADPAVMSAEEIVSGSPLEPLEKRIETILRNAGTAGLAKREFTRQTQFVDDRRRDTALAEMIRAGAIVAARRPTATKPTIVLGWQVVAKAHPIRKRWHRSRSLPRRRRHR
jgi:hypothetical protein